MRTTASTYWRRTVYLVSSTFIFIHHCTFKRVEVQIVAYACYYPLVGNDSVFTPTPHLFIIYLITIICHCQKWNGVFHFNCRANLWKMWLFSFVRASWWYHSFLSSWNPTAMSCGFFLLCFHRLSSKYYFVTFRSFFYSEKLFAWVDSWVTGVDLDFPFPNSHLRRTAHYLYPSRRIEVKRALVCLFEYTKNIYRKGDVSLPCVDMLLLLHNLIIIILTSGHLDLNLFLNKSMLDIGRIKVLAY